MDVESGFLGVIGGMGPLSTADFLRKLAEETKAGRDQDHVPVLVWGDSRIPDRTEALLGHGPSPVHGLRRAAEGLSKAGAGALVIACNTAHAWADDVVASGATPLLHIAEAAAREASVRGAGTVGLMATRGTVRAGFYELTLAHHGIKAVIPDEAMQTRVDEGITLVKSGRVPEARCILQSVFEQMRAAGADEVLLACTEIPVALEPMPAHAVDTTRALARAAVRWWKGSHAA